MIASKVLTPSDGSAESAVFKSTNVSAFARAPARNTSRPAPGSLGIPLNCPRRGDCAYCQTTTDLASTPRSPLLNCGAARCIPAKADIGRSRSKASIVPRPLSSLFPSPAPQCLAPCYRPASFRHVDARAVDPRPRPARAHRIRPCKQVSSLLRQQPPALFLVQKNNYICREPLARRRGHRRLSIRGSQLSRIGPFSSLSVRPLNRTRNPNPFRLSNARLPAQLLPILPEDCSTNSSSSENSSAVPAAPRHPDSHSCRIPHTRDAAQTASHPQNTRPSASTPPAFQPIASSLSLLIQETSPQSKPKSNSPSSPPAWPARPAAPGRCAAPEPARRCRQSASRSIPGSQTRTAQTSQS